MQNIYTRTTIELRITWTFMASDLYSVAFDIASKQVSTRVRPYTLWQSPRI